ncbi:MAG: ABC-F family ATP-binding cassette domain-containing protein [Treponema sp.]|jgi:ATP-binding cassette subfamily F protein 3|nr:ABC-F family ATP-binding cassette domain-containing protein [Treponema sp.]
MAFVQFSQVSLAFGNRDILKNVSVNLKTGTKAALTGANGAGKSTLIKIMAGLIEPDSGTCVAERGARIAYLPQSGLTHRGRSLMEEADTAFQFGYEIQAEIDRIGDELKKNPPNMQRLLERHSELLIKLEDSGWHRRAAAAESVLLGLGFSREDFEKRTEEFSGGWQMRIALAKALMQNPDILLLDEPTNYLDIEARTWLEQFLQNFKGAFLLVSHDRYFLDVTINEVYELFGGDLKHYPGNFTHYEKVRAVELQTLIDSYEQQQKEIQKLEDFIRRFGFKASKAAQAQERQKMLDKMVRIEIPESLKKIHFTFPAAPHAGRLVLTLDNVSKSYDGEHMVLDNFNLVVENGERLVVAGRNGAGKSTLLKIAAGVDQNFTGEIKLGAGVKIGYFSQDSAETIAGSQTIIDYIESAAPMELVPKVRDMLGAFLFRGDDVFKSLDVLSGGEKSRVALLCLLLRPVNLLLLDEPTNHLDMHSKDVLLSALKDFGGSVIFVSHDRGFIEGLATRVLELTPGQFRNFPGNYAYYLQRLADEEAGTVGEFSFGTAVPAVTVSETGTAAAAETGAQSSGQLSWEEEKRTKAERRKKEKLVQQLEAEIDRTEKQKAACESQMADPAVYTDGEKCRKVQEQISEITALLDNLNEQWEQAAEQLL